MKARDSWILVLGAIFLGVVILFPGFVQDIPQWGWAILGVGFFVACLIGMWQAGELGKVAKRGGIALLFFVPAMALISLLPGEEGDRDLPLAWVIILTVVPSAILFLIGLQTGFFKGLPEIFAKHPPACERCQMLKKDLIWVETANGIGARPRLSLCPDCVWNEIGTELGASRNRLLVAEPVRNAGGYYSLNVDGIAEWWDPVDGGATTQRVLTATRDIAEKVAGRCEECDDEDANVCWIPAQVFRGSWDKFSDLLARKPEKLLNRDSHRFLCGSCAAQIARQAARRLRLHLVSAPSSDTLIMLPGEA